MEINSSGIKKSDLTDYLGFWTTKLREVYGNNFVVKKEGVVDNIATSASLTCMSLEDVIMYLTKQMNPYTAEGEWQDALYAIVGLMRRYASYTVTTRTIQGLANTIYDVGSIRFKNVATDDIFELNTAVTTDSDGIAIGSFTAIELGSIQLESSAILEIIDAPDGVTGVYYSEGDTTTVGDDYEDDSEFRLRWIATNSVQVGSNTKGGMRVALLPLCDNNPKNINIRQNRNTIEYVDFAKHTMSITLKSAESDETIANTIFNALTDGLGLYGSTTVTVQDEENNDVDIKFTKATEVPIQFNIEVVLNTGISLANVSSLIKDAIINNFTYSMGERVVANDFYHYINEIDGVDYVDVLQVGTTESGATLGLTVAIDFDEYSSVIIDNITVSEAE